MSNVQLGKFNFNNQAWSNVSDNAKDFISKLLTMDPAKRMSAKDALKHVWLKQIIANDALKAKQGISEAFKNLS